MIQLVHTPAAQAAPSDAMRLSFDPCWFEAPRERSHAYFPAFSHVTLAVQAALRREVPKTHLSDIERFRDTRMVYPLLVYASSRPFRGQPKTEFTYDVVNRALMKKFYFSVGQNLPYVLAAVADRLRAAGMPDIAKLYRPDRSRVIVTTVNRLKICRRRLEALLVSETLMVNHLLMFAGSSKLTIKERAAITEKCNQVWTSRLRRLFAKHDYTGLAPKLLSAATEALKSQLLEQALAV